RLGGGVDADLRLAHVTGQGADQQNAAASALLHQPAEVVREGELRGDVEVDDVLEAVQVAGDELVAVAVGARVEDEQADVQAVGDLADLLQRVGGDEVQLQRPDLHALRADGLRGLRERAGLAGDEHEVQARVGQPVCEGGADPLRAAGDDGPR